MDNKNCKNEMKAIRIVDGAYYDPDKDNYLFVSNKHDKTPITLGFQITRRCNMNCIHCSESQSIEDSSLDNIKRLVKKIAKSGKKRIVITGGEPLCRNDIREIIKLLYDYGMIITFSTNGYLLDEGMVKYLKKYVVNIRFSLHGLEETHDKITRLKGSFKETLKAIILAVKNSMNVGVTFSILRANRNEVIDVAKLCEKLHVDKFAIFTLIARGRGRKIFDKEFIHISEVNEIMEKLKEYKSRENWKLNFRIVDWRIEGQCLLIFPNGDLIGTPCFSNKDNKYVLGNLYRDDLNEMWDKYPYKSNYNNYYKNH